MVLAAVIVDIVLLVNEHGELDGEDHDDNDDHDDHDVPAPTTQAVDDHSYGPDLPACRGDRQTASICTSRPRLVRASPNIGLGRQGVRRRPRRHRRADAGRRIVRRGQRLQCSSPATSTQRHLLPQGDPRVRRAGWRPNGHRAREEPTPAARVERQNTACPVMTCPAIRRRQVVRLTQRRPRATSPTTLVMATKALRTLDGASFCFVLPSGPDCPLAPLPDLRKVTSGTNVASTRSVLFGGPQVQRHTRRSRSTFSASP